MQQSNFKSETFAPLFENNTEDRRPPKIIHSSTPKPKFNNAKNNLTDDDRRKRNLDFLRATIPARKKTKQEIQGTGLENPNRAYSTSSLNNKINNRLSRIKKDEVDKPNVDKKFEEELKQLDNIKVIKEDNTPLDTNPIIPSAGRRGVFNNSVDTFKNKKAPKQLISTVEQMELESTKPTRKQKNKGYKKPSRYIKPTFLAQFQVILMITKKNI